VAHSDRPVPPAGRAVPPHGAAHWIETQIARVRNLGGWRRRAAAAAAGALSVLAMAPFFAWPVLWLTLPILVWLIDGADKSCLRPGGRRGVWGAAEVGWWFGFGYFLCGLAWVGEAFLVEAETFAALAPFAVLLLPAGLALFYAAGTGAAALCWGGGARRVIALALALSAVEWLRGHVLTGFPWNVLGYALTYPLPLLQSAAVLGIYGLTLAAILIFALPLVVWEEARGRERVRKRVRGMGRFAGAAIGGVALVVAALLGQLRLSQAARETLPGITIRIVQPSTPQRDKWLPEKQQQIFRDHLALSAADPMGGTKGLAGITHILWPEAAMPFLPLDSPQARDAIGRLLPAGVVLIAGALRAEAAPPGAGRSRRFYNSLMVFGAGGSLAGVYDKIHLVPFGEYLPLQGLAEAVGLTQLTHLRGGFDAGGVPRPLLQVPGLPPVGPLICYEVIFPGAIWSGHERPGLLINVTNDGWFGNSTGPRQHFHQARVRAAEEGLALIRAANNGISAAIDGYGRILKRLDLNVRGAIDVPVPTPAPPTPYSRFGDLIFLALWLVGAGALWRWPPSSPPQSSPVSSPAAFPRGGPT
jgi:apolipoprotein N-acyltransferase